MLTFIMYKQANEQIEILADDQGIEDLIHYLKGIKDAKDHMHLIFKSEIDDYPIPVGRRDIVGVIKDVRLEYVQKTDEDSPK